MKSAMVRNVEQYQRTRKTPESMEKSARCCPVCNEPITSETSFKVHKVFRSGKSPWLEMVHPECHAVLHKNDSCFVEPGSLTGAL